MDLVEFTHARQPTPSVKVFQLDSLHFAVLMHVKSDMLNMVDHPGFEDGFRLTFSTPLINGLS